nr:fibronectin type III domain-containing protein [Auritidibacter ignavus]
MGAYWYSSGDAADPKKPPKAISVSRTLSTVEDDALFAAPSLQVKDVTDTSAVATWSTAYGATGYEAQYGASGEQRWSELAVAQDNTAKVTDLKPKTPYVRRVRSLAGGNSTAWNTKTFTPEAKNDGVAHRITKAEATDGLSLELTQPGLSLDDLPAPTGRMKIAMLMGIFSRPVSHAPLSTADTLTYGMQTPNQKQQRSTLSVPADLW